jgi:hypothetical protein
MSNTEIKEPKYQQGSRILPKTRDNLLEVRDKFFKLSTPSSLVSDILELIFSGNYQDEEAIEQIKKYKSMVNVITSGKDANVA